jgi:hypothetical protein
LMECMSAPDTRLCASIELTFWQLMMGRIAVGKGDVVTKRWFDEGLRKCMFTMRLRSWNDALVILRQYFWREQVFAKLCKAAWIDMERG